MLKKFYTSVATAALCLVSVSAFAADIPHRVAPAPVFVQPMLSWNGCYVGAAGGYIASRGSAKERSIINADADDYDDYNTRGEAVINATPTSQRWTQNGGLIGATLGCNWQMNSFVAGLEGDISIAGVRGHNTYFDTYVRGDLDNPMRTYGQTTVASSETNWLGTVRLRAGFLISPQTLLYATGGFAFGGVKDRLFTGGTVGSGDGDPWSVEAYRSRTRTGWTVGGGVEHMINQHWSVKGEYLYYDLGSSNLTQRFDGDTPNGIGQGYNSNDGEISRTVRFRHNGHVIRVGANYHF